MIQTKATFATTMQWAAKQGLSPEAYHDMFDVRKRYHTLIVELMSTTMRIPIHHIGDDHIIVRDPITDDVSRFDADWLDRHQCYVNDFSQRLPRPFRGSLCR